MTIWFSIPIFLLSSVSIYSRNSLDPQPADFNPDISGTLHRNTLLENHTADVFPSQNKNIQKTFNIMCMYDIYWPIIQTHQLIVNQISIESIG